MSSLPFSRATFTFVPGFSAHWVGRDPHDRKPRVVHCFGPSEADDYAPLQAAALGLESALEGNPPVLPRVWGSLEGEHLVLRALGLDDVDAEVARSGLLPAPLVSVLRWRPEVLLLYVDVPLEDPVAQLPTVGVQHIWTGLAPVRTGPAAAS